MTLLTRNSITTLVFLLAGVFFGISVFSQVGGAIGTGPSTCSQMQPFCADNTYKFPNTKGLSAEFGPDYGCVDPNKSPAWYFMKIKDPGSMRIRIKQYRPTSVTIFGTTINGPDVPTDVDAIAWGPFSSLGGICDSLKSPKIVDCDQLTIWTGGTMGVADIDIPNAQTGEYYVFNLVNFQNWKGFFEFSQVNGNATTECCILKVNANWSVPQAVCKNTPPINLASLVLGTPGGTWSGPGVTSAGIFDPSAFGVVIGKNKVWYKVSEPGGCVDSMFNYVVVHDGAVANYNTSNSCIGSSTQFTDISTVTSGSISAYLWNFNTATTTYTSSAINPSFTYTSCTSGPYNTSLQITTSEGCVATKTLNVSVYCKPVASFTTADVCKNQQVLLVNTSTGASSYEWDFEYDNSVDDYSASPLPFLFPQSAGAYSIHLTAKNTNCSHDIFMPIIIHPVPDIHFIANSTCINAQPVSFNANGTILATGSNTLFTWGFGDGSSSNSAAISATTHSYVSTGIFNTTLTVTSDKGCVASQTKPVSIFAKPSVTVTSSSACESKPMNFIGGMTSGSGNVVNWLWDFNNSISTLEASGQSVNYVFSSPGNQTVSLITITDNGCTDTLPHVVYVDYSPKPMFSVNKQFGCPQLCVVFTDNSPPVNPPAVNAIWKWSFGNGNSVIDNTNQNQSHCYSNSSGTQNADYDVKLVLVTNKGCSDSLTKSSYITVYPTPEAAYAADQSQADVTTPLVYFTNQSQNYSSFKWHFGDGDTNMVDVNPTHYYNSESADYYNSVLEVWNSQGCKNQAFLKVEIGPGYSFYMPNAFTPGQDDGVNDMFTAKGIGIVEFQMSIFDRWGAMLYSTNDINLGWDGKLKNGDIAKGDIYIWKVRLRDALGKKRDYVGHVTLLR